MDRESWILVCVGVAFLVATIAGAYFEQQHKVRRTHKQLELPDGTYVRVRVLGDGGDE